MHATTLGELKQRTVPVRTEMERNLVRMLREGQNLFPGLRGYEDTVVPQVVHAVLAHHDLVFLGERGQGKSRLMRALAGLLDPEVPFVEGCEIHDDPWKPVCARCRRLAEEAGPDLPVDWWPREERYGERLAPGTRFADLLGDLDPARVAAGAPMGSEGALHFGLLPRFHRGIFGIDELPELDPALQVALFHVLEERDVQIRGYPVRFPLDMALAFTANPEDWSRSGRILPHLRDRIGAEIRTHYPRTRATAADITSQEARTDGVDVPDFMRDIVEQVTLEARNSPHVNHRAGVSVRLSIANMETLAACARRRALALQEERAVPRLSDLPALVASSRGRLDLDPYAEEATDEARLFDSLVDAAVRRVFEERFRDEDLEPLVQATRRIQTSGAMPAADYRKLIQDIPQLWEPVHVLKGHEDDARAAACVELVLEGLALTGRLSRTRSGGFAEYLRR